MHKPLPGRRQLSSLPLCRLSCRAPLWLLCMEVASSPRQRGSGKLLDRTHRKLGLKDEPFMLSGTHKHAKNPCCNLP